MKTLIKQYFEETGYYVDEDDIFDLGYIRWLERKAELCSSKSDCKKCSNLEEVKGGTK